MEGMPRRRLYAAVAMAGALAASNVGMDAAKGDDLVTLSGVTYQDVRPVRIEPDGVTWEYAEGMCKVNFADSPKSVCEAYHYDRAKAAVYHDAQVKAQQDADERKQQILKENDDRLRLRSQALSAAQAAQTFADTGLVYRRAASPAASSATKALGEQMAAAATKRAMEPTGAWGVLAHSRVGSILSGLGLVNFAPLEVVAAANRDNPRASSQTALSSGHAAHDLSDAPDYATRTYYDDTDRAAAFARGVPLKP